MSVFDDFYADAGKTTSAKGVKEPASTPSVSGHQSVFDDFYSGVKSNPKVEPTKAAPAQPVAARPASDAYSGTSATDYLTNQPVPQNSSVGPKDEAFKPITDTVKEVGKIVQTRAAEMRKSDNSQTRLVGAVTGSIVDTAKEILLTTPRDLRASKSAAGISVTGIYQALNIGTLGAVDFVMGAAPEFAGSIASTAQRLAPGYLMGPLSAFLGSGAQKKNEASAEGTAKSVTGTVQKGMEFVFNDIFGEAGGGAAAKGIEFATGTKLTEEERGNVKKAFTMAALLFGFHKINGVMEARSTVDMVKPLGESIGLKVDTNKLGMPVLPDQAKIAAAHKAALDKAAAEGGEYMLAKMDAADAARSALSDYKNLGPGGFDMVWKPYFESGSKISQALEERVKTKVIEAVSDKAAAEVNTVLKEPATKETRNLANNLGPEAQFAFEQEMVNMAAENDPKLQKKASEGGYTYERVDVPFDDRPAYFDAGTGKITLNEYAIRQTLDRVWAGDVLKVGEGRTTTVFRKNTGESFEKLKTRYEQTLVEHELSHAKTISPEDIARLRAAVGDEAKVNRIRKELEDKANEYSFQKANDLDFKTNAAVDAAVERVSQGLNVRENLDGLKYAESEREAAYAKWKNIVKRSPDYANANWDQLEGGLKKSPAYKGKDVKSLFENGLEKTGTHGSSKGSIDTFDRLLEEFQSRYKVERKILDEYKTARQAQQKLIPENKRNVEVDRAVKAELRAEQKVAKLEGNARKMDLKLLRERISRRLEKSVLKEKSAKVADALRSKFSNKQEAQQMLVDYMRENRVPKDVRSKFITDLKNANTPDDAAGIIMEIKREYNKYERVERVKAVSEMLNKAKIHRNKSGKNVGKMTAEAQREIDFVRKIAKESRNELNKQIVAIEAEARATMAAKGDNSFLLPESVGRKIELLELGGLKDQTVTQLKRTEAVIQSIIDDARGEKTAYVKGRTEDIKSFISSGSKELIGTEKRPKSFTRAINGEEGNSWARRLYNASAVFDDLTREMGGVFDAAGRKIYSAQHRVDVQVARESAAMGQRLKSLYGKNWGADLSDFTHTTIDLGKLPDANGDMVELKPTRAKAMSLYMRLREARGNDLITSKEGRAYTPEIIDKILSVMRPEDIKLADWLQKEGYVTQHKLFAPVYEQRTGVPLGYTEMYAGQMKYEKGQTVGGDSTIANIEDMMDASLSKRLSSEPGFVKSRVEHMGQIEFSDNPILDYMVYSKRTSQYVEMAERVQEWKSMMADKGIRESIKQKYGASFLDALQFQLGNLERGGVDMKGAKDGFVSLADKAFGNVSAALLANPRVWAGQFSSIAGLRAEAALLPGKQSDFWTGMKKVAENEADLEKYAPGMAARLTKTPSELLGQFSGDKGKVGRALDKMKDIAGIPLEKADAITTKRGASGIFEMQKNHYIEKGFPVEEAKRLAGADVDGAVTRSQSVSHFIGKSQLEAGAMKYFVQLQQQPTKIFRGNIEAGKLYRQGRITGRQYTRYLVWNNVVQAGLYTAFRAVPAFLMAKAALYGAEQFSTKEDVAKKEALMKEKFSAKGMMQDWAFGSVTGATNLPILGNIISTIAQNVVFKKNYESRPTLLNVLTDDLFAAFREASDGNFVGSALPVTRLVSRSLGVPDPIDGMKWLISVQKALRSAENDKFDASPAGRLKAQKEKLRKAVINRPR